LPSSISFTDGEKALSDYEETVGRQRPVQTSAFSFHGNWGEYLAIAVPNVLLTIVTLGFYRFWATTRERKYLWSRTQFIDERLEWTGTGMELFIGFVMVFFLIGLPLIFLQFGAQALIMRGMPEVAGVLSIIAFLAIFYLTGVAYYRALRYRLSRTYWRGIRGGSDDQGLGYGLSYMWKNVVAAIPLYLLYPWATMSLWNERWNMLSFGPYPFRSNAQWTQLMKRYLLFYLAPFLLFVTSIYAGVQHVRTGAMAPTDALVTGGMGLLVLFAFFIVLPVAALLYYAKYYRVAVAGLSIGELDFEFKARSPDWILFFIGNWAIWAVAAIVALIPIAFLMGDSGFSPEVIRNNMSAAVIGTLALSALIGAATLGLVNAIIRYRSWKFFATHMEAYGEVNLDQMSQSETVVSGHGEGLLDAFDVGAI
jgi:uncharacterized membrane protein YjgN (DUF898 family)